MSVDLDKLEALWSKASRGPWIVAKIGPSIWSGALKVNTRGLAQGADSKTNELFELSPDDGRYAEDSRSEEGAYALALRDAKLIEAMHAALPEMIRELRELRAAKGGQR